MLAVLCGCAAVPPDRDVLPQRDLASAELASDIKLASEGWPEAAWWTQYGDEQLDALVKQALQNSPTLQVAATRIGAARSAVAAYRADAGLNVSLNASVNRQRFSSNGLYAGSYGGNYYNEQTVAVQADYNFDWWGRNRARVASAVGEVNASRADYAMAEQSLAAEVAQSYFTLQSGWARMDNYERFDRVLQDLLNDRTRRVQRGLTNIDQQYDVEALLAFLRQEKAALAAQIKGEREALRALLGADASALADLRPRPVHPIAHGLPSRLGMELLARRPDLQAARWRVQASLSRIEASQAAFYPDINLSGSVGLDAVKAGDLLKYSSRTLFVGPTLSLPLFDSNRLGASLDAARSERNELIADYNRGVIQAVRDVARAGVAVQGVEAQISQQVATLQATEALLKSAQSRFKRGLADRGTVLTSEMGVLLQVDTGLQLQGAQLNAEVALVKALGGGYRIDEQANERANEGTSDPTNKPAPEQKTTTAAAGASRVQ
jgi:multidrug efflux system outer membrane protein